VASSTVPVTSERFRVERNGNTPFFSYSDQEETSHPEVISHILSFARTDLEFPLRRHNLSVDTRDVDSGVQASAVVSLDHVTSEDLSSSDTAVVRTLRTGETSSGPSVGTSIGTEDGVFLLETELLTTKRDNRQISPFRDLRTRSFTTHPGIRLGDSFHSLHAGGSVVELVGSTIVVDWISIASNKRE
jgi:hypothetical protein